MFLFFLGTQSGIIKMASILQRFKKRDVPYIFVSSGQHIKSVFPLLKFFNLDFPIFLAKGDVASLREALIWLLKCSPSMVRLIADTMMKNHLVVVHGDCFSAFMGSVFAKSIHAKLIHVEAGCRTSSFFDPFPEMFHKVLIDRLSDVMFTASDIEYDHLMNEKVKGKVVNTKANTVLDAMRFALKNQKPKHGGEPYAVSTIHRFETLYSHAKLTKVLRFLDLISNEMKVYFFSHDSTAMLDVSLRKMGIVVRPLLVYPDFIKLVSESEFVVTDSGGLQHEAYYMGKPCLVMRNLTETYQGIGENTVLSRFREDLVREFLRNYDAYRIRKPILNDLNIQPSKVVVDVLEQGVD